jgi:ABC-2 type transport system permease protein
MVAERRKNALWRLLELWSAHARLSWLWLTRDARHCLTWVFADLVCAVASISGVLLLAERFQGIGRWSRWEVLFMLGYAQMVSGLLGALFGFNILFISRRIGRGQLDHTLLQPQPVWMSLFTEGFSPVDGVAAFTPGLALIAWSLRHLSVRVTPEWTALLLASLAASGTIVTAFSFICGVLAFWAPRGAEEISSSALRMVDRLRPFPLDGVPPALAGGLLTLLPVGFAAWYPSRALLGHDPVGRWITPLAAAAFAALAALLFGAGLRQYGRTGSLRYSDFGHRR